MLDMVQHLVCVTQLENTIGRIDHENFVYYYLKFRKYRITEKERLEESGVAYKPDDYRFYPSVHALQDLAEHWYGDKSDKIDELVLYNAPTEKAQHIINVISNKHPKFTNNFYWESTSGEQYWQVDILENGKIEFSTWKDMKVFMFDLLENELESYVCDIELSDNLKGAFCTFRTWLRQIINEGCCEPFKNLWAHYRRNRYIMPCRRTTVKAGKFLKMIDPALTEQQISILASDICDLARLYDATSKEVKVSGIDFATIYTMSATFSSCMQGKPSNYFELYKRLSQCRIAYIESDEGYLLGRALLWDEALTERGSIVKIMDRIYSNNAQTHAALQRWAVENGYLFRSQTGKYSNGERTLELNLYIDLSEDIKPEEMESLPYMDTFKMYKHDGKLYSWSAEGRSLTTQDGKVLGVNVKEK